MSFPQGFLWGGDISAAQCEGAWDEDGRSPTETDFMTLGNVDAPRYLTYQNADGSYGKKPILMTTSLPEGAKYATIPGENYPNRTAVDHYHHMEEDIALFAEMGFKALNLTISWARVYPYGTQGGVNQAGVDFYRRELEECRKYGIEPVVTLYKYDMPVYFLTEMGGWSDRRLVDEFVAFAKVCFEAYKGLVKYWITFNEINVLCLIGYMDPTYDKQQLYTELHHQLVASAKAVQLAHDIDETYLVGSMNCGIFKYPLTCDPKDIVATQKDMQDNLFLSADVQARGYYPSFAKRIFKEMGVTLDITDEDKEDLRKGKVDFFAFSYYNTACTTTHVDAEATKGNLSFGKKNPYLEASDWGWQIDPDGLKYALHMLYDRYQIPLLIVENGLGAHDVLEADGSVHDPYHGAYMGAHIAKMGEAIDEGVDLIGYTMWSTIDLCAASTGEISKRYGQIYVDVDDYGNGTYKRIKKDSFYWYKKVIASNGEDLD